MSKQKTDRDLVKGVMQFLDNCPTQCAPMDNVEFEWGREGMGFGRLYFYYDEEDNLRCHSECMSKDFAKQMLCKMIDDTIWED